MRIGIDLMGGDSPPSVLFEAVLAARETLGCHFVVVGTENHRPKNVPGIDFIPCLEFIEMNESPLLAVRRKKDSSMAQGLRLLKSKQIDAFVSSGNTGALVTTARVHLPKLPNVKKAALCVLIPKFEGNLAVLDVGANVHFNPQDLLDYAKMGIVYKNQINPKIALLNIGIEEQKGTKEIQEGFQLLSEYFSKRKEVTFIGNVEPREVFQKGVDILLTEGFTGNIFLKTCEGAFSFLMHNLKRYPQAHELLLHLDDRFSDSKQPGAILLGVDGLVIKCHGHASRAAFTMGILGAASQIKEGLISKIKSKLNSG